MNVAAAGQILSGQMSGSGPDLDAKMVHLEQNQVQKQLNGLNQADPAAYGTAIKEINTLLNSKGQGGLVLRGLAGLGGAAFGTDKAYSQILDGVRKSLGHQIDFANQKDREAIGNVLVKHVRETGGCDVTGDKVTGCK